MTNSPGDGDKVPAARLQDRWGDALAGGFVVVPSVLLKGQGHLGLDCEETMLLINLLDHWWATERKPFPRSETLARLTGLSRRTVQRRLKALEGRGLIARHRRGDDETLQRVEYDL